MTELVPVARFRNTIPEDHRSSMDTRLAWLWKQRFGTVIQARSQIVASIEIATDNHRQIWFELLTGLYQHPHLLLAIMQILPDIAFQMGAD